MKMNRTRSEHNTPGMLKMDVHTAWPKETHQVLGLVAEDHHMYIPVRYSCQADERIEAQGEFGAWLGYAQCHRHAVSADDGRDVPRS